jgi:hypothetical protein
MIRLTPFLFNAVLIERRMFACVGVGKLANRHNSSRLSKKTSDSPSAEGIRNFGLIVDSPRNVLTASSSVSPMPHNCFDQNPSQNSFRVHSSAGSCLTTFIFNSCFCRITAHGCLVRTFDVGLHPKRDYNSDHFLSTILGNVHTHMAVSPRMEKCP